MQVEGSVKLPARLLTFALQIYQELTHSDTSGHIQVPELDKKKERERVEIRLYGYF